MLQSEFEDRVKMKVSADEFNHINEVYMNSDLEKDEFCKEWAKMNRSRIHKAAEERKQVEERQNLEMHLCNIIEKLQWLNAVQMNLIANRFLNNTDKKYLKQAGISVESKVSAIGRFKYNYEILFEVRNYINK